MRHVRAQRAGFTLIEVVVAMGVLLLGMSVIIGLLSFGASTSRTAALRTSAAAALPAIVTDLEETLFPLDVEAEEFGWAGEPVAVERREVPGHPGIVYSAVATPNPESFTDFSRPEAYRVDIEITWDAAGSTRARRFTTLLHREVPFGERLRVQFVEGRDGPDTGDE